MTEVFVDTAGWASHFDRSQPQHSEAVKLLGVLLAQRTRLVTTNYVLLELVSLFTGRRRVSRPQLISAVETVRNWRSLTIIHIDPELDRQGWELLKNRPDKNWSLVDCCSFLIMEQRNIVEALTTDHHFEQAGFVRLLRP